MSTFLHMEWPTRLATGLLAWPVMIFLAAQLSYFIEPGALINGPVVVALATAEVLAAAVAIVFPVWALITWGECGDEQT